MANSGFKMNGDWKKQLDAAIKGGMNDLANDYTKVMDSLGRRYRGRSVAEIKPVLRRKWRRVNGGDITDPELTKCAKAISEGTRVEFRNGGIK